MESRIGRSVRANTAVASERNDNKNNKRPLSLAPGVRRGQARERT
jgi:hypothetical protein